QAMQRQIRGGEIAAIKFTAFRLAGNAFAEGRLPAQGEDVVVDAGFRLARHQRCDRDKARKKRPAHQPMAGLNMIPSSAGASVTTARSPSTRTLPSAISR